MKNLDGAHAFVEHGEFTVNTFPGTKTKEFTGEMKEMQVIDKGDIQDLQAFPTR